MNQSRLASGIEAVANTAFGFTIQVAAQYGLFVFFDVEITTSQFWLFSGAMTVLSVARGYMIRRLWNMEWWKRFKRRAQDQKIKRITLDYQALAGMRPLTLEEQRELLLRLRRQVEADHVAQSMGDAGRAPDRTMAVGTLPSAPGQG
jgi:hypothetical protein